MNSDNYTFLTHVVFDFVNYAEVQFCPGQRFLVRKGKYLMLVIETVIIHELAGECIASN